MFVVFSVPCHYYKKMHIIKKHKLLFLLIAIFLLVILSVGWLIVRPSLISHPVSSEMLGLRELETYLALPSANEREEDDSGDTRDSKGAHHYTRSITFHYKALADIQQTLDVLPSKGWVLLDTVSGTGQKFFVSQEKPSCISVLIHPEDNTSYPLKVSFTLMAPTDDACEVFVSG